MFKESLAQNAFPNCDAELQMRPKPTLSSIEIVIFVPLTGPVRSRVVTKGCVDILTRHSWWQSRKAMNRKL